MDFIRDSAEGGKLPAGLLKRVCSYILIAGLAAAVPSTALAADPSVIKPDEEVILFSTAAGLSEHEKVWVVTVHGWIFEREEDSAWRNGLVDGLLGWLEIGDVPVEDEPFNSRARMFLVDNERGKKPVVRIGDRRFTMEPSGANGHFRGMAILDREGSLPMQAGQWVPVTVCSDTECARKFTGAVQLVPPDGVSVISDIDDTIKISNVTDKTRLLQNTFLKEYKAVPGMSEVYRRWADNGAVFHYVSASPWQLYPVITEFLQTEKFPAGSYHMKTFRVKDRTFFDLFRSPEDAKLRVIDSILKTFPGRKFILVGDSGEKDPEIYAAAARQYPKEIRHIFIRNVEGGTSEKKRIAESLRDIPGDKWTVFDDLREVDGLSW